LNQFSISLLEEDMSAVFKTAYPYARDKMNLPVENVEAAIPFYETVMGFRVVSRNESPHKSACLARDDIQIGLAENGGDPSQEGCFFEVDNAEAAFAELKARGLGKEDANFRIDQHGDTAYKVFFVVAPDGLCYCLGERQ
jgi:catechol 2,3-dioxygenase-like lactoylglutathione lyase family enzyme